MIGRPEPFRVAFALAALTALRAIGPVTGDPGTHAGELVYGFMVIQLFGFLLVALPRWIGRPLAPSGAIWLILAAHAVAFLFGFWDLAAAARLRALVGLAGVVLLMANTPEGKTAETWPVLLLAGLHAGLGLAAAATDWPDAVMAGLAVILIVCLEVSNRVGAALIAVARERNGYGPRPPLPRLLRYAERGTAMLALGLWGLGLPAGPVALLAALLGTHWLVHQRPWQIRPYAGVVIMAVGMAMKRLGLMLMAVEAFDPAVVPPFAVIHVLAVGGLATLAIAIATSIVRKREKRSLAPSRLANAVYGAIVAVLLARLAATVLPGWHDGLVEVARWCWAAAFAGYAAFILRRAFRPAPGELPHLGEP